MVLFHHIRGGEQLMDLFEEFGICLAFGQMKRTITLNHDPLEVLSSHYGTATEASKVAWVGTCHNPEDGKDYLISYNDCCGKTACGRCLCNTNEREMPGYRMGLHNDINWCMANDSSMFHCTTGVVVGMADGS